MLRAGQEAAMKPAQLLQLADSIAAKQAAQAEASGTALSQDCVLLHCVLLQVRHRDECVDSYHSRRLLIVQMLWAGQQSSPRPTFQCTTASPKC